MTLERPTFSPFWHRLRAMKPRLRPHVQITRQHYRGRRWHVVHDPTSNQFYRLSPIAHELVATLDGVRTVEEAWNLSLETHGDEAPTQPEVIELMGQLYNSNLLALDVTPETDQLLARGRDRTRRRLKQQAIGIMYLRLKLFNPDGYLSWLQPILKPLLNKWGFLLWAGLAITALFSLVPYANELATGVDSVVAPSNWFWLLVVWIFTKAVHETGHGVICKHFGGQVPEFGVMLLVLLPSPYVDASSTWAFANKWRRMAVGAGGMIFELAIASIAAFGWIATRGTGTESGQLIHQLCYNAMLTSGVSTVLFNANPLMRFDGYYILSDLLEVPNLMQRSQRQLQYFFQRHVFRMKHVRPVTTSPGERFILYVYGALSTVYRVFLFFAISLYLMGKFFAIGFILAVWSAAVWLIMPVGKYIHWLATSPALFDARARVIATSVGLALLAIVVFGVIPMPDHRRGTGVVESEQQSGVYFGVDGFVEQVHRRAGDSVKKGDPILTLTSTELLAQRAIGESQLAHARTLERDFIARYPAHVRIPRDRIVVFQNQLDEINRRVESLIVRAPQDGVIVGNDPGHFAGMRVQRGQQACQIIAMDQLRVSATLTQAEASWLYELPRDQYDVQMRRLNWTAAVTDGGDIDILPAGQTQLAHSSLTAQGGGSIETDPRDQSGLSAKTPQFVVRIHPAEGQLIHGLAGERVGVRFTLPSKPLLFQWLDRFQKLVQGRVQI